MTILLIILIVAAFVVYTLPQLVPLNFNVSLPEPPVIPHQTIRLFDGPNDGQIHEVEAEVDKLPHFFVAPYLPTDDDGNPMPDEENIVRQANGMVFVKPNFAYYQQVTDQDYIYVRDINDNELDQIKYYGTLPKFKPE